MPYSAVTKQIIKDKKALLKGMENAWNKGIAYAMPELYKEAERMYDSFIDQFYAYETKSYIRHGETRPGTCRGINLYRGQQFELKNKVYTKSFIDKVGEKATVNLTLRLNTPIFSTNISAQDMEYRKYHDSAEEVLELVTNGIRGVPDKGWWIPWMGSYEGKYFSTGRTTMAKAFEMFDNYFDDMLLDIMLSKL